MTYGPNDLFLDLAQPIHADEIDAIDLNPDVMHVPGEGASRGGRADRQA